MSTHSLLRGSIDMHIHAGPDPRVERSVDALEAALQAREAGMRAIVLKSHEYPTAPLAYLVNQVVPDITVLGSICLDREVGGLNPHAVEASAGLGARVVWMPTFSSANDMQKKGLSGKGVTVLDEEGRLLPVVGEILEIIKQREMVMATGHLSAAEVFALVEESRRRSISRVVVTHPLAEGVGACLGIEDQRRLAEKGAFIEHPFNLTTPLFEGLHPEKIAAAVKAVGAGRCILSTDLGQSFNMVPAEGMRVMIATMLKCGLSEGEIALMVKENPARLLGLD